MEKLIENITNVLKTVKYPGFSRDIVSFGIISKISTDPQNNIIIDITLSTTNQENKNIIEKSIHEKITSNFNFNQVIINFLNDNQNLTEEKSESVHSDKISNIKKVIAISSCKGGVGKSTVALNVACELSKKFKVGLLDLDIYGPSLPTLINYKEQPNINDNIIDPVEKFNIKFMSFGFINNENSPTIWRGPMVSRMTQQFFENVKWGELDYLILDLPPGTGDIQLTLVQKIKLTGAIIVTTPQDLAHVDVKKGSDMFSKVDTPILGVVENMVGTSLSGQLTNTDLSDASLVINDEKVVFDKEGNFNFIHNVFSGQSGKKESKRLGLPLLGQIPLDYSLSKSCDIGQPYVINNDNSNIQHIFSKIVNQLVKG